MVECGASAAYAYPAMGGGSHAMCEHHAERHRSYCVTIEQARVGIVPDGWALPAPPRAAPETTEQG